MSRALCPDSRLLSVPIWSACAEQGRWYEPKCKKNYWTVKTDHDGAKVFPEGTKKQVKWVLVHVHLNHPGHMTSILPQSAIFVYITVRRRLDALITHFVVKIRLTETISHWHLWRCRQNMQKVNTTHTDILYVLWETVFIACTSWRIIRIILTQTVTVLVTIKFKNWNH